MIGLTYSFILLPIVNSLFIFLIPKKRAELFRPLTVFLSLIPLGLCLYVFLNQDLKTSFYVVDKFSWISAYGIDLIIVNFYPFQKIVMESKKSKDIIENIREVNTNILLIANKVDLIEKNENKRSTNANEEKLMISIKREF